MAGWATVINRSKLARLTFYRMESTAAYDDSVVVGSIYYSLDPGDDKKRTNLKRLSAKLRMLCTKLLKIIKVDKL